MAGQIICSLPAQQLMMWAWIREHQDIYMKARVHRAHRLTQANEGRGLP